jgi:hypothetical protein
MLSARVAVLPYGAIVRLDRVQQPWVQVTVAADGGAGAGRSGWLRAVETVEAATLGTRAQARAVAAEGDARYSLEDASAAGRQWLETERKHRATSADLRRAYPLVNRLEQVNAAVDENDVEAFVREGRLGHPGQ